MRRSAPMIPERVFRYRKYWDYSGGISTDLFVHLITSIHFIMDAKVPSQRHGGGRNPGPQGRPRSA